MFWITRILFKCSKIEDKTKMSHKWTVNVLSSFYRTIVQDPSNSKYVLFAFFHAYENLFHKQNVLSFTYPPYLSRIFLENHPTKSIKFGHVESYGSPNSISAGGDQSFCGYDSRIELAELDCDALSIPIFKMITFYQSRIGDACYQLKSSHSLTSDIKDNLEEIFSSSSCLNSSFLADDHYKTNS